MWLLPGGLTDSVFDTELPVAEQGDSLVKCALELNRVWEEGEAKLLLCISEDVRGCQCCPVVPVSKGRIRILKATITEF